MTKEVDTKLLDRLIDRVEKGSVTARVGYFDDSGKHPRTKKTAADIATINNNGSVKANIPARPWVTDGAFEGELPTHREMRKYYERFVTGELDLKESLRRAAQEQKFRILQKYDEAPAIYANNRPFTVEKKGFDMALFDTGWLQDKIDVKVYEGE